MPALRCVVTAVIALSIACSTVRQIRPLERGQSTITTSLGGPITEVGGVYIPLPLLSVGYNRGILDKKLDLEMGLHLTQLLYGIFEIDAGVNYRPFLSKKVRPGLIVTPRLFFFTDFSAHGTRLYPSLSLTPFWQISSSVFLYTGLENWFEFYQTRDDGNEQNHHWLLVPYLGVDWGRRKTTFQVEMRIYTPNLKNTGRPTKNIGLGEYSVIGGFIGINYQFGGKK